MYKISIIIPFFNTPKFLFEKCINSIKKQSYTNFECLIINDCSTNEKTVKDAAAMIKMDKRFKMLNNEKNSGCGLSRDHGVLESTGDIITFVDSDDFIEKSYLEYMDNQFSKHEDLDMLILGYKVVFSDGKDWKRDNVIDSDGPVEWMDGPVLYNAIGGFSPWAKGYRRSFMIEKKIFNNNVRMYHEDLYHLILCYSRAKKIMWSESKELYNYYVNLKDSMTSKVDGMAKTSQAFQQVKMAFEEIKKDNTYFSNHLEYFFTAIFYIKIKHFMGLGSQANDSPIIKAYSENKDFMTMMHEINQYKESLKK